MTPILTRYCARAQRRGPASPLSAIAARHQERDAVVLAAHDTGQCSYQPIAERLGILHFAPVWRIVRAGRQPAAGHLR